MKDGIGPRGAITIHEIVLFTSAADNFRPYVNAHSNDMFQSLTALTVVYVQQYSYLLLSDVIKDHNATVYSLYMGSEREQELKATSGSMFMLQTDRGIAKAVVINDDDDGLWLDCEYCVCECETKPGLQVGLGQLGQVNWLGLGQ